jgi:hypothetical protein
VAAGGLYGRQATHIMRWEGRSSGGMRSSQWHQAGEQLPVAALCSKCVCAEALSCGRQPGVADAVVRLCSVSGHGAVKVSQCGVGCGSARLCRCAVAPHVHTTASCEPSCCQVQAALPVEGLHWLHGWMPVIAQDN